MLQWKFGCCTGMHASTGAYAWSTHKGLLHRRKALFSRRIDAGFFSLLARECTRRLGLCLGRPVA